MALWVLTGLVLAVVLGRRGHDPITWGVMAAVLGPLALLFAVWVVRHDEHDDPELVSTGARSAPSATAAGLVDVMVGYDGSVESDAVVDEVIELFGARLGRLKIVDVVRYDPPFEDVEAAKAALVALAERIAFVSPDIEIAHGRPAVTLQHLAAAEGFDVLAVGTSGARHLFGSAAEQLAHHSVVPVLLGGHSHRAA
jgi:nucleotide-binding universal stress UspA family protein